MLEGASPSELSAYTKRMETLRLPEGLLFIFTGDPGECILHVMQQTGSHIQLKPGTEEKHFRALAMFGTAAQNAQAKQLLQDSSTLR